MRRQVESLVIAAIENVTKLQGLNVPAGYSVQIERARDSHHGDFACNIALVLSKQVGMNPPELAAMIVKALPETALLEKVEIAGPGFINFFLTRQAYLQVIATVLEAGDSYGQSDYGGNEPLLLEFVSANPTGPLHIGHGRGAAYGAALANLLKEAGYAVTKEYYVNDAGRQMDILAISVWLRYLALCGQQNPFPKKAYQAEYVQYIAGKLFQEHGNEFEVPGAEIFTDAWHEHEEESQLDLVIAHGKQQLGAERYQMIFNAGLDEILDDIRADLQEFGVTFDNWFSEQSLAADGLIDDCLDRLKGSDDIYEEANAFWFRSSHYGDEKDRVVIRDNGQKTYFASDIAYHLNKFERGFSKAINIWGADHHGYIDRVKAALTALGKPADALDVLLVQFATLYRGSEKMQMSTRSGEYITLRQLRQEVGDDAARFFYVTRKSEQHLDFDLDLAKSQSNDNPVYYIQYAHARICSVMEQMAERGYEFNQQQALKDLERLIEPHEQALATILSRYPETVVNAARSYEPHLICFYLRELATAFHAYYNSHQFLIEEAELRGARISLILATRQVIRNGLRILGVSAPEKM